MSVKLDRGPGAVRGNESVPLDAAGADALRVSSNRTSVVNDLLRHLNWYVCMQVSCEGSLKDRCGYCWIPFLRAYAGSVHHYFLSVSSSRGSPID